MMSSILLEAHRLSLSDKARYNFDSDIRRWTTWRSTNNALTVANHYEIRDFVLHCATIGFERRSLKLETLMLNMEQSPGFVRSSPYDTPRPRFSNTYPSTSL